MFDDGSGLDEDAKRTYAHLKAVCDAMATVREEYIDYVERGSIPAHSTAASRAALPHDSEEHHRRYKVMTRVLERMSWGDVEMDIVKRDGRNALRLECGNAAAEMRHSTTVVLVDGDVIHEWNDVTQVRPRTDRSPVLDDIYGVPEKWLDGSGENLGRGDRSERNSSREKKMHRSNRQTELTDHGDSTE